MEEYWRDYSFCVFEIYMYHSRRVLGNGENNSIPLECVPLSCWVPRVVEDLVLSTVAEEGEIVASKVEHSKWVSTMMNRFCKMVGYPIVKHEAHCVALFRLLEQEGLEETKLASLNSALVWSLWGSPFIDWAMLDAVQTSGGVLLVWDKWVVKKIDASLVSFLLVFFLGEFWTVLNGSELVYMVPMLIIIGLLCGRSCPGTLVSVDWVDHFGNVSQRVLPRVISNHCPLLVEVGGWVGSAVLLSLRICGSKLRVLSRELNSGGRGIALWAPQVSF
ncbi:hypothetical protein SO802_017410 [Lithocarpus litseifolius]|uniref:Uncharacterized protein n=1 Tax=Lithocarpus litseifolius TaxID=425828 RepID=A0AAW2CJT2_9ROSI